MKKILSLIIICILCHNLCACDAEVSKTETTLPTSSSDAPAYSAGDRIEFNVPVVLVNDAILRVEVTNFFQELSAGLGTSEKDKYITLKMNNRTDHELLVILDQLSINNNGADVFRNASSIEIAPKTDVVQYFRIRIDASTPLADMSDLFQLRGTLTVYRNSLDNERTKIKTAHFYVAEAFAAGSENSEETQPAQELSLGDTAKTDMTEFTLEDFEIRNELMVNAFNIQIRSGNGTVYTPDKGMVYAAPIFTIRNTAKENYSIDRTLNFAVDYNDGYLYEMDDYTCYITHEEGTWERNAIGTSRGQRPDLPPLMSNTYQVFIPAIDLIESDVHAPLRIVVTLPSSEGTQDFVFRIR